MKAQSGRTYLDYLHDILDPAQEARYLMAALAAPRAPQREVLAPERTLS